MECPKVRAIASEVGEGLEGAPASTTSVQRTTGRKVAPDVYVKLVQIGLWLRHQKNIGIEAVCIEEVGGTE